MNRRRFFGSLAALLVAPVVPVLVPRNRPMLSRDQLARYRDQVTREQAARADQIATLQARWERLAAQQRANEAALARLQQQLRPIAPLE